LLQLYSAHPPDSVHFTVTLDSESPQTAVDDYLEEKVNLTSADERLISNLLAYQEESLELRGKFMEQYLSSYMKNLFQLLVALSGVSDSNVSLGLSAQIEDYGLSFVRDMLMELKDIIATVPKIDNFAVKHPGHSENLEILGIEIPTISAASVSNTMQAIASSKPVTAVASAAQSLVSQETVSTVTNATQKGFGMVGSAFSYMWKSVDNFLTDMDEKAATNASQGEEMKAVQEPLLSSGAPGSEAGSPEPAVELQPVDKQ
jgi:hypothetical protein